MKKRGTFRGILNAWHWGCLFGGGRGQVSLPLPCKCVKRSLCRFLHPFLREDGTWFLTKKPFYAILKTGNRVFFRKTLGNDGFFKPGRRYEKSYSGDINGFTPVYSAVDRMYRHKEQDCAQRRALVALCRRTCVCRLSARRKPEHVRECYFKGQWAYDEKGVPYPTAEKRTFV